MDGYDASDLRVSEGTLLAAGPDMLDPNFMHRVVLLCRHSDEGAYGLVINRVSEVSTREVFASHPVLGAEDAPAFPISIGGPVGLDTVQVLHRVPEIISGGLEVAEGIHVGGELEDVARYVVDQPEAARETLVLALGYSGGRAGRGRLAAGLAPALAGVHRGRGRGLAPGRSLDRGPGPGAGRPAAGPGMELAAASSWSPHRAGSRRPAESE